MPGEMEVANGGSQEGSPMEGSQGEMNEEMEGGR